MTIDFSNIELNPRTPHLNQPKSVKKDCLGSAYPNGARVGSVFALISIDYMLCLPVPTQIYIHRIRNVKSIVINRNLGRHPRQHRKIFEFISFLKCVRVGSGWAAPRHPNPKHRTNWARVLRQEPLVTGHSNPTVFAHVELFGNAKMQIRAISATAVCFITQCKTILRLSPESINSRMRSQK